MEQITILLKASFIAITFLAVWQFYRASNQSKPFLILMLVWMTLQFLVVQTGFYANSNAIPPRLMFQLLPTLVFILVQFSTTQGRRFSDSLNIKQLTLIHIVRIPVEIVLYYLFIAKAIP